MLPLHAGTTIVLTMCAFCIGYGIGYLQRPKRRETVVVRVPHDRPQPGNVLELVNITSDMTPTEIAEALHLKHAPTRKPAGT